MIFEKLSDNKIKIILSKEDMKVRNIEDKALLSNHLEVQSVVQDLLLEAEKRVDFKTADDDLVVESVLSSNGDFVFTITKLCTDSDNTVFLHNVVILKLKNLGDFISFCTYVNNLDNKDSLGCLSLYLYNGEYYLCIYNYPFAPQHLLNSLVEFGDVMPFSDYLIGAFQEYGKKLLDSSGIDNCIKWASTVE